MSHLKGVIIAMAITGTLHAASGEAPGHKMQPVPFTQVRIDDAFWAPRIRTNREVSIPHNIKLCEETGRLTNFDKAAGRMPGKFEGTFFNDSDVYKMIEGAAYSLATHPDPELDRKIDEIVARIAAAQQKDGYLNTYFTLAEPDKKWANFKDMHELYCAGHLIEAAVAHHAATGKRNLLDVAIRFADCIDNLIGPGKKYAVCGHEEIELALVKLYKATGEERYFKLAQFFVDERGNARPERELLGDYCQDHIPLRKQSEIVGHAVRAVYLYCGAVDVAAITGDTELAGAMERIWNEVAQHRLYITGGIGNSAKNEGFTTPYDLPNDTAYGETCAAIGYLFWNHRLNMLSGNAKYANTMEQTLYNGLISGVSLDGTKFFYENRLGSRGDHHRQDWYGCACCPPNVLRMLASLGQYIYATGNRRLCVNLYIGSSARADVAGTSVSVTQKTGYPWDGKVELTVAPASPAGFDLSLRMPAWCAQARVTAAGQSIDAKPSDDGYLHIDREWKNGDKVEIEFPMDIRRVACNPKVSFNHGRAAIQRGPMLYCIEAVDNGGKARNVVLPRTAALTAEMHKEMLGGVTVIKGEGHVEKDADWKNSLYAPAMPLEKATVTAVPYCVWDNRQPGEMVVWIPEAAGLPDEPAPAK